MLRALAADLQGQPYIRAASSLPENLIAAVLHAHGHLDLQISPDLRLSSVAAYLADMPETEFTDELLRLYSELYIVRALMSSEEPTVHLGGFSAQPPGEDVGQREETVEAMVEAAHSTGLAAERNAGPTNDATDIGIEERGATLLRSVSCAVAPDPYLEAGEEGEGQVTEGEDRRQWHQPLAVPSPGHHETR